MNEQDFRLFMKRAGRSQNATDRCVAKVAEFERFLGEERGGASLGGAGPEDLAAFVADVEKAPGASAKAHLWAIRYYFDHVANPEMSHIAAALRQERIERKPFALRDFRGVDQAQVERLEAAGLVHVQQMLQAGSTVVGRAALSARTGLPLETILEFVKLSDLARIPGVKAIRARLYLEAGVDAVEKIACWQPEELRQMLVQYVERTGFEGAAPQGREAEFTVATARKLPPVVEY